MKWVSELNKLSDQPDVNTAKWLTKPYVLSAMMKKCFSTFSLSILSHRFDTPSVDDKNKLALDPTEQPFIREVELLGDGVPMTYGRVTIPLATYQRYQSLFETLDNQPMGEKILYNNPNVTRSSFEYAYLTEKAYWGRRSIFFMGDAPLLVTEGFYATLPEYPTS